MYVQRNKRWRNRSIILYRLIVSAPSPVGLCQFNCIELTKAHRLKPIRCSLQWRNRLIHDIQTEIHIHELSYELYYIIPIAVPDTSSTVILISLSKFDAGPPRKTSKLIKSAFSTTEAAVKVSSVTTAKKMECYKQGMN